MSPKALEQINKNKQVLIFLNRRGYAPLTMCEECGHIEECPRCDTSLVLHKTISLIKCHHCSYQKTQPQLCSECGSNNAIIGKGTQQLEEGLKEQFPDEKIFIDNSINSIWIKSIQPLCEIAAFCITTH